MASFLKVIFKNYSLGQALRAELEEDLGLLVRYIPGLLGFVTRYLVYKPLFGRIGSVPYIYPGVRFVYMGRIRLGKNVLINSNSYIYGKGGLEIGDSVLISPNCAIVAGDHDFESGQPILEQPSKSQKIVIGQDSWIGANSVVVGGVRIGRGSIIGAGAVVTADTEEYSINVGVPARKVGQRPRPAT
ncbi:MAG: acyltransferase [Deltaproteobacteria bacterium]|nr:acyltransferase [Deltaproteobacteria bacterium]